MIATSGFLTALECIKIVFGPGSAPPGLCPVPRWGSSRRSPDPLVGWVGVYPLHITHPLDAEEPRRLWHLGLVAYGDWTSRLR